MNINQIKDYVSANPGASYRLEELLFRWNDNGLQGSHVTVMLTMPTVSGPPRKEIHGPFPVSTVSDDPLLKSLLGDVRRSQQAIIDSHSSEIAVIKSERDKARQERDSLGGTKAAKAAVKAARRAEVEARILEAQMELEALSSNP